MAGISDVDVSLIMESIINFWLLMTVKGKKSEDLSHEHE